MLLLLDNDNAGSRTNLFKFQSQGQTSYPTPQNNHIILICGDFSCYALLHCVLMFLHPATSCFSRRWCPRLIQLLLIGFILSSSWYTAITSARNGSVCQL